MCYKVKVAGEGINSDRVVISLSRGDGMMARMKCCQCQFAPILRRV